MREDPIVEEVRRIRFQIEKECNNDIEEIYQKALELQKSHTQKLVIKPFLSDRAVY
mgnify:CR=1 FL=1